MENKKKKIDPLPDSFVSEKEAGEFWDTHSSTDYIEHLEESDDEIEIKSRVFEVQISEDVFQKLRQKAETSHQSVPKIIDGILRKELTSV